MCEPSFAGGGRQESGAPRMRGARVLRAYYVHNIDILYFLAF